MGIKRNRCNLTSRNLNTLPSAPLISFKSPCVTEGLRRSRRRLEDNITMDLKEIFINTRNWVDSAQVRDYWRALVDAAFNLWDSQAIELAMLNEFHLISLYLSCWNDKVKDKVVSLHINKQTRGFKADLRIRKFYISFASSYAIYAKPSGYVFMFRQT